MRPNSSFCIAICISKCIVLPRQARDKHRESTLKKGRVSAELMLQAVRSPRQQQQRRRRQLQPQPSLAEQLASPCSALRCRSLLRVVLLWLMTASE